MYLLFPLLSFWVTHNRTTNYNMKRILFKINFRTLVSFFYPDQTGTVQVLINTRILFYLLAKCISMLITFTKSLGVNDTESREHISWHTLIRFYEYANIANESYRHRTNKDL